MHVRFLVLLIALSSLAGCLGPPDDPTPGPGGDSDSADGGGGAAPGSDSEGDQDPQSGSGEDSGSGSTSGDGDSDGSGSDGTPSSDNGSDHESDSQAPVAFLEASHQEFFVPFTVTFDLDGWDPDGDSVRWSLLFGDGNSTRGTKLPATVEHTYMEPSRTVASFIVKDGTETTSRSITIDALERPVPISFAGSVLLPDRFNVLDDGSCMTEKAPRAMVDAANNGVREYNAMVRVLNEAIADAHQMLADAKGDAEGVYNEIQAELEVLNETVQAINDTVYRETGLQVPYSHPGLPPIPELPHPPGLEEGEEVDYLQEGVNWDYQVIRPGYWGWKYGFDQPGLFAEFRSANWTLLGTGTGGVLPEKTTFIVICMTPWHADERLEDEVLSPSRTYELAVSPPERLLENPGPEVASQKFVGSYGAGLNCGSINFFVSEVSMQVDPATYGLPFTVGFHSVDPVIFINAAFYDGSEEIQGTQLPDSVGVLVWNGTVPEGATQARFSSCGGTSVEVDYSAGGALALMEAR